MKWYDRTNQKLKEIGWTGAELSRRAEIEIKTVYKYLDGKIEQPRGNVLSRIANALNVSELWLMHGTEDPNGSPSIAQNSDSIYLQVPIIDGKVLTQLIQGDVKYSQILLSSKSMPILKKEKYSNKLISITVEDDKNSPELHQGDEVIVDLEQKPTHGKLAVAAVGGIAIVAMYTLVAKNRIAANALHFLKEDIPDIMIDDLDYDGIYRVVKIVKDH